MVAGVEQRAEEETVGGKVEGLVGEGMVVALGTAAVGKVAAEAEVVV